MLTRMPNWPINIPCTKDKICLQHPKWKKKTTLTKSVARKKRNNAKRRNWNENGNEKKRGFKRKKNDVSIEPIGFARIIPEMAIVTITKRREERSANESIARRAAIMIPKMNLDTAERATSEVAGIAMIVVAVGKIEESAVETRNVALLGTKYVSIVLCRCVYFFCMRTKCSFFLFHHDT